MDTTKPHIYVVDDDEAVRKALSRFLIAYGFTVDTFDSSQRFLDSVSPNNEGCVLMDIHMPEFDGFELIKSMSILNYTVRVIFITALAETGDYERAVQAGVDGFLLKPFTDQSLLDLIGAVSDSMYRKKAKHSGEER